MRLIDAQFLEAPWYGARHWRLMAKMGLARFGRSEIVNTDQGSQFTASRFTGALQQAGIWISIDGRGR
jgi:transposase InsO family protein